MFIYFIIYLLSKVLKIPIIIIRLCINCPSTKNVCINKCDMVVHQIPRLISVFVHRTHILLVLSCGFSSGSLLFSIITYFSHTTKTVTSWADAQTAQIASFEIALAAVQVL